MKASAALRGHFLLAVALLGGALAQPAGPTITKFPIGLPAPTPLGLRGITGGPDGTVWFVTPDSNAVGRIRPSGTFTQFPLPVPATQNFPINITLGPDCAQWYVRRFATLGRITTCGVATDFGVTSAFAFDSITTGPDGALWVTGVLGPGGTFGQFGTVGRFDPVTHTFTSQQVTDYPHGAMPQPAQIEFSPTGSAVVLYSKALQRLQVVADLPSAPRVAREIDMTHSARSPRWQLATMRKRFWQARPAGKGER
jgi:streptogramin lyase